MLSNIDSVQLLILAVIGLGAHVALLFAGLFVRPLALLTGAFLFLAAFSVATEIPYFEVIKYARVYTTLLIIGLGVLVYRAHGYGPASIAMLMFIGFYMFAAIWGPMLGAAILWKGLYLTTVLSGITLAMSIKTAKDMRQAMRVLMLASAAFILVMLSQLLRDPASITHIGRFGPFGMNPNRAAQTMANMTIISAFVALHDPRRKWKVIGYATVITSLFLIMMTGARGGLGMALIGSFALSLPLLKRPFLAATLAAFAGGVLYLLMSVFATESTSRLEELSFDTRGAAWSQAFEYIRQAPILGQGWVIGTGARGAATTQNLHSIYLQVLAETGIVGFAFFFVTIITFAYLGLCAWRRALQEGGLKLSVTYLAGAFVVAVLAHGVVESASMAGSTIAALMMGFGVGLIDRINRIDYSVDPEWHRIYGHQPADASWYGHPELTA